MIKQQHTININTVILQHFLKCLKTKTLTQKRQNWGVAIWYSCSDF